MTAALVDVLGAADETYGPMLCGCWRAQVACRGHCCPLRGQPDVWSPTHPERPLGAPHPTPTGDPPVGV